MSDELANSSDSQARRRRRRRRRGGIRGEGPGGAEPAERAGGSPERVEGDRRPAEGAPRRERTARPEAAPTDGGRAGRDEDRARRRRRRRRRGDGDERPAEPGGERAGGAPERGEDASAAGREGSRLRGGRSSGRARRRGGRITGEVPGRGEARPAGRPADRAGWPDDREDGPDAGIAAQAEARAGDPWQREDARATDAPAGRSTGVQDDTGLPGSAHASWDGSRAAVAAERAPALPSAPALLAEREDASAALDLDAGARGGAASGAPGEDAHLSSAEDTMPEEVTLRPDLPAEPPDDDPDPLTWPLLQQDERGGERALDAPVRNIVGVKLAAAGRIYLYDAGDQTYQRGEEVVVETDRGVRMGVVAVDAVRKRHKQQDIKRILRRPNRSDLRLAERNQERSRSALKLARDTARAMDMPVKIFRVEYALSGKKAQVYFTAEDRVDFRDLVRELSQALCCRVEMRQTGVRDEAKLVGGIGSCGQELCCTTWLPEFVPVSIKMAKDQGLVLNPTKVSGQCGRLKCCLVYEQSIYAELRRGLPKLGKRVITEAGEGRVVEVDVLHQRVRVSLGPGEFQVFEADQVKPMFPSQPQSTGSGK